MGNLLASILRQIAMALWHVFWIGLTFVLWIVPFFWDGKHYFYLARRCWAPGLLWICSSPPTFVGVEKIDWSKPHVLVANHQGNGDVGLLFMAVPKPLRFLAKRSVAWIPFIGWSMRLARFPFIDRDDPRRGQRSIDEVAARIQREGINVVVFPEGTRSPEGTILLPFKKGAFILAIKAQVPILPIAIEGSGAAWPRGSLRIHPQPLKVTVGDPIPTVGMTLRDRDVLRAKAEEALQSMLGWKAIRKEELPKAREEDRARRAARAA